MSSIKNFFSSVAEVCSPNKGTISGAMDVVVIVRSDGTLASTPFHVKFGRFTLMKANKIKVNILINEVPVPLQMELTKTGKALFIRNTNFHENEESKTLLEESDQELNPSDEEDPAPVQLEPSKNDRKDSAKGRSNSDALLEEIKRNPPVVRERHYRTNEGTVVAGNNLSSNELKSLHLLPDENSVTYVTEGKNKKLQGRIFLWRDTDQIVVSDIDGTLTKSDVMGHLCYLIGKDWSRGGVVSLYNSIILKGYKILYLSSRSLSQKKSTMCLLREMNQQGEKLPQGPILLNPDGMLRSIVREISNYSQVFKENALAELLQAFPLDKNPYFAGFGNRSGDAVAYYRVGIPVERIFILNSKKKKLEECSHINNFTEVSITLEETFPDVGDML